VHLLARPRARLVNPRSKQRKVAVAFVLLCETSHRSACVARRSAAALPALAKCYRQQGLNHLPTGPAACMHAISVCTYDAVAYGIASRKRTTRERCCSVASHILAWFDLGQTNKQRPHICSAALAGTLTNVLRAFPTRADSLRPFASAHERHTVWDSFASGIPVVQTYFLASTPSRSAMAV
jgi:hypothetical protein